MSHAATQVAQRSSKARYALAIKSTVAEIGDKSATKSTVDFVAGFGDCRLSTKRRQIGNNLNIYESRNDPVTSDVRSIQWHVQLGRLCRKWVIFVARMSNILSTLSPVCTEEPKRRGRLCRLSTVSNSTLSPVCIGLPGLSSPWSSGVSESVKWRQHIDLCTTGCLAKLEIPYMTH